jgi:hypothetical protein
MAFIFCQLAHAIDEFERGAKIHERVALSQVMFFNHFPPLKLSEQDGDLRAAQRGHAAATGNAPAAR